MELIINIPGEIRKLIKDNVYCGISDPVLYDAIKNGVALPAGHGDLIDGDYLYKRFVANKCPDSLVLQFIKEEPTIIEADKEVKE